MAGLWRGNAAAGVQVVAPTGDNLQVASHHPAHCRSDMACPSMRLYTQAPRTTSDTCYRLLQPLLVNKRAFTASSLAPSCNGGVGTGRLL